MINHNDKKKIIEYLEKNLKIEDGFIEDKADLVDKLYDVVKLDDLRECLENIPCNDSPSNDNLIINELSEAIRKLKLENAYLLNTIGIIHSIIENNKPID